MTTLNQVQRLLAWARIWSPLVDDHERAAAWQMLDLPGCIEDIETEYWSTFHAGMPAPRVSLLFHAATSRDGTAVREEWMLVLAHLGLKWSENVLPPDHLGSACEILAVAVERQDDVLTRELCSRYFRPWCAFATQMLGGDAPAILAMPSRFGLDVENAMTVR